jgi:hypothetical protein
MTEKSLLENFEYGCGREFKKGEWCIKKNLCYPCHYQVEYLKQKIKELKEIINEQEEETLKKRSETWEECAIRMFIEWDRLQYNIIKILGKVKG